MPVFEFEEQEYQEVLADEPFSIILPSTSRFGRVEYTCVVDSSRPFFFDRASQETSIDISDSLDLIASFVRSDVAGEFRAHLKAALREGRIKVDLGDLLTWILEERARLANLVSEKTLDRPTLAQESSTGS